MLLWRWLKKAETCRRYTARYLSLYLIIEQLLVCTWWLFILHRAWVITIWEEDCFLYVCTYVLQEHTLSAAFWTYFLTTLQNTNFYGWRVYRPKFCSNMWLLVDPITRAIASASTKFPNRWKRRKKEFLKFSRGNCDGSNVSYEKGTATSVKAFSLTAMWVCCLTCFYRLYYLSVPIYSKPIDSEVPGGILRLDMATEGSLKLELCMKVSIICDNNYLRVLRK